MKREKRSGGENTGIRLSHLNVLLICMGLILGIIIAVFMYQTTNSVREVVTVTNDYLSNQQTGGMLRDFTRALSEQATAFVQSSEPGYARIYEAKTEAINKQLDQYTKDLSGNEAANQELMKAVRIFRERQAEELRAIRLAAESMSGSSRAMLPPFWQKARLTEEEQQLAPEEKKEAAIALLTSEQYTKQEEQIITAINNSHRLSSVKGKKQADETFARVKNIAGNQTVLVALLLVMGLIALVLNRTMIISPIRKSVENLDRREPIKERGCYEMRHLARVYNEVLKDNQEKTEALTYTATHDALTGVYNRAEFDQIYSTAGEAEHTGLIVVDVDHFKQYNDEFGHDVGDKVLCMAAEALKSHFFFKDHISRIGGDEFCVIMPGTDQAHGEMMLEKIRQINRELADNRGDLPPVTLSAGIAFWDRPDPNGTLFQDADSTLLDLKRTRADCCAVYTGTPGQKRSDNG